MTPAQVEEAYRLGIELHSLENMMRALVKVSDFQMSSTGAGDGYFTGKASDFGGNVVEQVKDVLLARTTERMEEAKDKLRRLGVEIEAKPKRAIGRGVRR